METNPVCEKIAYNSFYEAQKVVNRALRIGRVDNRRMANKKPKRVYKCEQCGAYHLTSQKNKK
jgi:hypothetical protein